ncbi:MAG TPA: YceI family protein, partial [Acidimicrobiales bacterium]|nr:YceI family protein [Acidimicrobiales bacterium]
EVLVGQQSTAVGRTSEVWGSLTVLGTSVSKGSFTANMGSVVSDQPQRNAQFDGRIMDVSAYPTATFVLTKPIALGSVPANGTVKSFEATGDLTMHGETKPVTFSLSAERSGASIYVLADINIVFANWGIANPSFTGFVTTQDHGTLEVLLRLTKGTGNVAQSSPPTSQGGFGGGPGGPPTVPSTTVPPLTVPKG